MRGFTRRLGLFGDVAASGVLVAVIALVNLAGVMVFARSLGPTSFGLFSTCRRVIAFGAAFANLGTNIGVSRYLGYYANESRRRSAILGLAILLCTLTLPTTVGIFVPLQMMTTGVGWIADLQTSLWFATAALTAATATGLIVFSTLRGFGHPQVANLHQLTALSSFLVLGIMAWGAPVVRLFSLFTVASVLTNLGFMLWVVRRNRHQLVRPRWSELKVSAKEMSKYSLPRVVDAPLLSSLSLICVLLAPGIGGLALSGYIHISQTIVRVTEVLIVPLNIIFLPLVARQVREGRVGDLSRQAQLICDSVVLGGCFVVAQGVVWAKPTLAAAFGPTYDGAMPYVMATLPAILPFLLYAGFRSFIDGYSVRPVNLLHLSVSSLAVLGLATLTGGWRNGLGLALAYTAGTLLLGALSVSYAARRFGTRIFTRNSANSVLLAAGSAVIALPVARSLTGAGAAAVLAVCGVTVLVTVALWSWVAYRLESPMLTHAVQRIRAARFDRDPIPVARNSGERDADACIAARSAGVTQ